MVDVPSAGVSSSLGTSSRTRARRCRRPSENATVACKRSKSRASSAAL